MPPRRAPPRADDLVLIHVAKRDLGLDDSEYRDLLWTVARVRSAKDLDHAGRARLIEHFRKCGWAPANRRRSDKPASEWTFVFRLPPDRQPQAKKLFRLAQAIGALQSPPVDVMPKAWVEGTLKRMRAIADKRAGGDAPPTAAPLEFATDAELRALVVALEVHRKRITPETTTS